MANEGSPYPCIETLHSYEIPCAYGHEGFIHFYGYYPILEKIEPTGTELDTYEKKFCLPQTVTMVIKPNETSEKFAYLIEIYKRVFKEANQIIYYRIINAI